MSGKSKFADWSFPLWIALFSGATTLAFGAFFSFTVQGSFPSSFHQIWTRWDSVHYLSIAENGYSAEKNSQFLICFFPLYPIIISEVRLIFQDTLISAILVSNVAFAVGLICLFKLVELDYGRRAAEIAVVFCAFFPTAYFFHLAYTESLFFSLSVAAFYMARKQHWWVAGILAFLCSTTRLTGLALCPALLLEYLHQNRFQWRAIRWEILAIFSPLAAFAAYLWLNQSVLGDPFAFLGLQKSVFFRQLASPWVGFLDNYRALFTGSAYTRFLVAGEQVFCFLSSIVFLIWSAWKLRPSYTVFATALWLLIFCYSFWLSVPRYLVVIFPLYFFLAWLTEKRPALYHNLLFASTLLYALGMLQFAMGRWAH